MPRNGKGGAREGTVGQAYSNRTDLNGGKMPISAATNQEYGEAGAQRAAQGVVPMGTPTVSTAAPQSAPEGLSMAPMASPATPLPRPGSMPYLDATQRPDEPVTAGLPFGPGPGTEAMVAPRNLLSKTLTASGTPNSMISNIASIASLMGM